MIKKDHWLYGAALVSGMFVWVLVSSLSGRREAWDSELYFTTGIPILCLVAGVLGFVEPEKPWRWGLVPYLGEAVGMFAAQGVGTLWPLGLVAFGIFSIPSVVTARIGAAIATRRS